RSDLANPIYQTSSYFYDDSSHPNYITRIKGPNGAVRNEYDEEGRLVAVTDPGGHRTQFNHTNNAVPFKSPAAKGREIITDPLGHTNTHEFDANGNIVATIDGLGHVIKRSFVDPNHPNNKTQEIDPTQRVTDYAYTYVTGTEMIQTLTVTGPYDPSSGPRPQTVSTFDAF